MNVLLKDGSGLDRGSFDDIVRHFDKLSLDQYKRILALLLEKGLKANEFDYPRGIWPPPTPARAYIQEFLNLYEKHVKGRCVEFNPALYKEMFIHSRNVTSYDTWNIFAGEGVTVVADLQDAHQIADSSFDTVICTHVLSAVPRPWKAVEELWRVLSPGGLILFTAPCILQKYAPDPKDCWRFTRDSVEELFSEFSKVDIHTYGNAATVAGSPYYLMTYHFSEKILGFHDESCPSIVAAAVWK